MTTHTILTSNNEIVRTDYPVGEIASGRWGDIIGVSRNGVDVTRDVFRSVLAVYRDRGYSREELPEFLVDSTRFW